MLLAVDLLIAFTLVEAFALWLWHRSGRGGVAPGDLLPNMASGLCLMAALRCALAEAPWPFVALWVCAAGLAHAWDLTRRWKSGPDDGPGMLKSRRTSGDAEPRAPYAPKTPSPPPPTTRMQAP